MDLAPLWHAVGTIFGPLTAQTCLWACLGVIAGMILMAGLAQNYRPYRQRESRQSGNSARNREE